MADEKIQVPEPQVTSQKGALVGDEAVQAAAKDVEPEVVSENVSAQVAPKRESDPKQVPVHETVVATDTVITDPSSPEAVQVPDAGRGSTDLPIHQLAEPKPEDVFSSEASKSEDPEPESQPSS